MTIDSEQRKRVMPDRYRKSLESRMAFCFSRALPDGLILLLSGVTSREESILSDVNTIRLLLHGNDRESDLGGVFHQYSRKGASKVGTHLQSPVLHDSIDIQVSSFCDTIPKVARDTVTVQALLEVDADTLEERLLPDVVS